MWRYTALLLVMVVEPVFSVEESKVFSPNTLCTDYADKLFSKENISIDTESDSFSRRFYRVYDKNGRVCRTTPGRIKHGDKIRVGVYFENVTDTDKYITDVISCTRESDGFLINEAGFPAQVSEPAGSEMKNPGFRRFNAAKVTPSIQWFPEIECFSDNVILRLKEEMSSDPVVQLSLPQYPRYRGALQLGFVNTKIIDRNYSLVNGVILAGQDNSKGPEYVASLLVYGLPNYLKGFAKSDREVYSGRDIVNEFGWKDRISLSFSIGINEPKNLLGVGFGLEIVKGINLTMTSLYQKVDVLSGVSVGDSATGDIPLKSRWEHDVVGGISIDGRYLSRLFGGGRGN